MFVVLEPRFLYYVRFIILFQDAQDVPASSSTSHSNPEARSDSSYVIFVFLYVDTFFLLAVLFNLFGVLCWGTVLYWTVLLVQ